MRNLCDYFYKLEKKIITVIGSGGKTSLILLLAEQSCGKKVLVTTTTRMYIPKEMKGVCVAGKLNEKSGKLESLPLNELEESSSRFDLVLIEGDGSRELPFKAWAEWEPVVPPWTDLSIGIIPLWPLGMAASGRLIHRPLLFSDLTGIREGETIKPEHIAAAISGLRAGKYGRGLFTAAAGMKILFFNQIEDEKEMQKAGEIVALLPAEFRSGLHSIVAGSVKKNRLDILWE
ncbi:MAG: putative selenium-dependent hydroxylase accessory protein YqeC [Treponema sp.]|jgi:probable selenium-dependent hydroxylase accessory protein YqeC|nr:putative selenium-dependent hydroxylase accessory protein YqeC [Treponema sp.]